MFAVQYSVVLTALFYNLNCGQKHGYLDGRRHENLVPPDTVLPVVSAPLFTARTYEYDIDSVHDIILRKSLAFYGKSYGYAYIISNGGIGFDKLSYPYSSQIFGNSSQPLISPFWSRNDLRKGGVVYYRAVFEGPVLQRGQREIRYQYGISTTPKSALVVTWENMQPQKQGIFLKTEDTNTFQAVVFLTDKGTFVNFIYVQIGWGLSAKAGFNSGYGPYQPLPRSGSKTIVYLSKHGNTGIPGEWMFKVDESRIISCKSGIKGRLCNKGCELREWGHDCFRICDCPGHCKPRTGTCV